MKNHHRSSRQNVRLGFERLEPRMLLANDVLPDIFAWDDVNRGYLHDYVVEGDLLRFTTAFANKGAGNLEVFGGDVLANGNQEVLQRIYDDEGGFRDRVAGEFTYHSGHGHIHFDGYAIYNLREIGPGGEVGDIVATGGKVSFCLIDITRYDSNAGSSNYGSCGTTQGVSAGWSDVYSRGLADQWINISGVDDGDYYLEVVTDPENQLLESDETNNTTIITVTIQDGPGAQGDRYEPNNSFATAYNLGMFSDRVEAGLSIHTDQDVDYFQFNAVDHGEFEIHVNFSHDLGNIDAFVYDSEFNLIASGESVDDLEDLHFHTHPDLAYYLKIVGVDGITNGYDLEFHGPGEVITDTVTSDDVPISIPDSSGSSTPGQTVTSTLEGPNLTLTDLNLVFADLRHTYLGDLHIDLTSPAGTTATIIRSTWESQDGPLGGQDNFINTFLDDQAPVNITAGNAPYTGSFNVDFSDISHPLALFNGESALGTWTVSITDWYAADTGTLNAWGLMFTGIDNNPGDALEQNDAFPQATDLGTIGTVAFSELSIHNQSDVDFFRFTAQDSTQVQIDLGFVHGDGNLDFIVYDSNQQEVARADSINDNESLTLPVEQGELYYLEVLGLNGAINDYSLAIDVPRMVAESGNIGGVDYRWKTVNLSSEFDQPVIIVSAPGSNPRSPVTVEINNVTSHSFDVRLNGWASQTDKRSPENLNYFVVEAGAHTLRDGTRLVAGHYDASDVAWTDVSFVDSFDSTPIVFTQIDQDLRNARIARLTDIDANGFSMRVQSNEYSKPQNLRWNTHWLAIEPGTGSSVNGIFEVGKTGQTVTHQRAVVGFTAEFASPPGLILSAQTTNDLDPADVRIVKVNDQLAGILMEEERSLDNEIVHGAEAVGYFAFLANNRFYAMEPQSSGSGFKIDSGSPTPGSSHAGRWDTLHGASNVSVNSLRGSITSNLKSPQLDVSGKSDATRMDAFFTRSIDFAGNVAGEDIQSSRYSIEPTEPRISNQNRLKELTLVATDLLATDPAGEVLSDAIVMDRPKQKSSFLVDDIFENFQSVMIERKSD